MHSRVSPLPGADATYRQGWQHFFAGVQPPAQPILSELAAGSAQPTTSAAYVDATVYVETIEVGRLHRAYAIYLAAPLWPAWTA